MVGIVIVSHSENLAKSVVELTSIMSADAKIVPAGGMDDGGFGTSYEKIYTAIDSLYSDDGVLVLMDMGSAVMTTDMVIEALEAEGKDRVSMVDCPLVEGAVVATINAVGGMGFEDILVALAKVADTPKF